MLSEMHRGTTSEGSRYSGEDVIHRLLPLSVAPLYALRRVHPVFMSA
jgi:hypothetical protein